MTDYCVDQRQQLCRLPGGRRLAVRIAAPYLALSLLTGSPAAAAHLTLTGKDLLSVPQASFPSWIAPTLIGESLVFAYGTNHGPPYANLVRFQVNADSGMATSGDVTISVAWNITRLACNGFCAGGTTDWDPYFALSDGSSAIGFVLGDDNNGQIVAESAVDSGSYSDGRAIFLWEKGTGFPAIGDSLDIQLDFTLHDKDTTARIRYLGVDESWTFTDTLMRSSSLALLLAQDNDSGERYQVNSLRLEDGGRAPEPATLALVGLALLGLVAARRRG